MQTLNSTLIRGVALVGGVLTVELRSGQTYQWDNVPQDLFDLLVSSESPGAFFGKNIRTLPGGRRLVDGNHRTAIVR